MLKRFILCLSVSLACAGCTSHTKVAFEWFNLSTNEIWVIAVTGLPADASPGRLIQNRSEGQLESSESIFSETVWPEDRITIKWKDNGRQGWPGGLGAEGGIPLGTAHEVVLRREDLGIPAKLTSGRIRFTYLGNDKWRIRLLK